MSGLSVVSLLAYDYRYAFRSIASYYGIADEIIFGLDSERLSWMRNPFELDLREIETFIAKIDHDKKIRIVEGDFHSADHPMVNDVMERGFLAKMCVEENWVVQIDADEILLNAVEFREWLLKTQPLECNVRGRWIGVFKQFGNQMLVIDPPGEQVHVATMSRAGYISGRDTGQPGVMSPLEILHFSSARSPDEFRQKLQNWGHAKDFDTDAFFKLWENVTLENYHEIKDFHPIYGPAWHSLKAITLNLPEIALT